MESNNGQNGKNENPHVSSSTTASTTGNKEFSKENDITGGFEKYWISLKSIFCGANGSTCIDNLSNTHLFIFCCIAASLSLIFYLSAFSCEVSWILEHRGQLPTPAYLLCTFYFILFIASTILIHGLVTGLAWGLFSWATVIGISAIPELFLVMYMTTQYWGLQSTHGLVELIGYLIRLVIICLTLIAVIPTALRWRREKDVLNQLETLASRLQISSPTPTFNRGIDSLRNSAKHAQFRIRRPSGFDNLGYLPNEHTTIQMYALNPYGSQNEFNASIFGLNPSQYIGPPITIDANRKKTQSLLDLRYIIQPTITLPTMDTKAVDTVDSRSNMHMNNGLIFPNNQSKILLPNEIIIDPLYYTADASKRESSSLMRNCVSLENLNGITQIKNDFTNMQSYGNNIAHVIPQWPPNVAAYHPNYRRYPIRYPYIHQVPVNGGFVSNQNYSYVNSSNNSRQSLGNESDDYRKYRDFAL